MKAIWTAFAALAICAASLLQAQARPWKPEGTALAQDYAIIQDQRPGGELVILFWFVPQLAAASPTAQAMLEKYVLIAAVHAHVDPGGAFSFEPIDALSATDTDGKPLNLLQGDNIPPMVAGSMVSLSAMMKQAIGQMGQGMHFFAFDAGNVHSCAPGRLSVPLAGETYTYDTPFPGCPKP